MMKRILGLLIILCVMLTGTSLAETLVVPVWQDDTTVNVEMALYQNSLGFTMAYDPLFFEPEEESPDTIRFMDYEYSFINFQCFAGFTLDELSEGLVLQSGTDDCIVCDAAIGGLLGDPIDVTAVLYSELVDNVEYEHSFYLFESNALVFGVECYYPLELNAVVSADFSTMMQTISFNIENYTSTTVNATTAPASSNNLVRCEVCGKWFRPGNEFRNHICTAETYPSE